MFLKILKFTEQKKPSGGARKLTRAESEDPIGSLSRHSDPESLCLDRMNLDQYKDHSWRLWQLNSHQTSVKEGFQNLQTPSNPTSSVPQHEQTFDTHVEENVISQRETNVDGSDGLQRYWHDGETT